MLNFELEWKEFKPIRPNRGKAIKRGNGTVKGREKNDERKPSRKRDRALERGARE